MRIKHLWAGIALAGLYLGAAATTATAIVVLRDSPALALAIFVQFLGICVGTSAIVGQVGNNEVHEVARTSIAETWRGTAQMTGRPQEGWDGPSVPQDQ